MAEIVGRVVDGRSNEPLSAANISVEGTSLGTSTAANGRYRLTGLAPGGYSIRVSMVGYTSQVVELSAEAGDVTTVNFRLDESWVEIPEIVVERVMLTGGYRGLASTPGSAHFISPAELEKFSYADVTRVLGSLPGVNVQEEDGYGLRPNIGLRGSGSERSSRITVMEDGILIAPAPYAAPAAYYFPSVGRMEAVEVRKGSSQIKFGPYTTGGAVNLVSTRIPARLRGRLDLVGGTDGRRDIHAAIGNSYEHFGFLVETYQTRADGFKELDGGGPTGFDKKDFLAKVQFSTGSRTGVHQSLTLKAGHVTERSDETYLGLTDADFSLTPTRRYAASQRDVMDAEQSQFVARHVVRPAEWLDVTTTLYRTEFSRNWYKLDGVRADPGGDAVGIGDILLFPDRYESQLAILEGNLISGEDALDVKANNRSYYAMGAQTAVGLSLGKAAVGHTVELGFRVHRDEIDRFQWVDTYAMNLGVMELTRAGVPGTESNRVENADALAWYAQYRAEIGRLTLIPGVRFEHVTAERTDYGTSDPGRTGTSVAKRSNTVDVLIPGAGVDFAFAKGIHAFAGVHKGFAPPGSQEGTRPESSINYEAGFRLLRGLTVAEAVFFYNHYDNLLGSDLAASGGQGTSDQFNGGTVEVAGVELSGTYDIGQFTRRGYSIPLGFTYTFTSAEFRSSFESDFEPWDVVQAGDELPYVPKHLFGLSAGFESTLFSVDLSGKFTGRMRTVAGSGDIVHDKSTDAHLTLDVAASYRVSPYVSIFGSVLNLTDEEYVAARRPAGVRPGLPRHIRLGVKTRL